MPNEIYILFNFYAKLTQIDHFLQQNWKYFYKVQLKTIKNVRYYRSNDFLSMKQLKTDPIPEKYVFGRVNIKF